MLWCVLILCCVYTIHSIVRQLHHHHHHHWHSLSLSICYMIFVVLLLCVIPHFSLFFLSIDWASTSVANNVLALAVESKKVASKESMSQMGRKFLRYWFFTCLYDKITKAPVAPSYSLASPFLYVHTRFALKLQQKSVTIPRNSLPSQYALSVS